MVVFGSYFNPMDRSYETNPQNKSTNDVGVAPIKDIGLSVPFGIAAGNIQGVASKIRTGTRVIELQFPGAGRSNRQAQTPGLYGKRTRQALEELGRANEVEWTTHGSMGVMGMAGMDQQGNFSKQAKEMSVQEIKRAIEFAADVARGGSIVVHTGEFQRPLSESFWNKEGPWAGKFKLHSEEPEKAVFSVINSKTGQLVANVRKDQKVARPVWNTAEKDYEGFDVQGNAITIKTGDYIDYKGRKITPAERMPKFNEKTQSFELQYMTWDSFEKEADDFTKRAREFWKENKEKEDETWITGEKGLWLRFKDATNENQIKVSPEEAFVLATLETNAATARGWGHHHMAGFKQELEELHRLEKEHEYQVKKDEFEGKPQQITAETDFGIRRINKAESIKNRITLLKGRIGQAKEAATAQLSEAKNTEETMRHVVSSEKYGLGESYDAYSEGGLYAMKQWNMLKQKAKKDSSVKLKDRPLFISMEHIFPESYGGHPDEAMNLVEGAREAMAQKLEKQGYEKKEAKRLSEQHIKLHIDTGHLNIWRKYWQDNPKKNPEENTKEFDDWLLNKVTEMAEKKMVGAVHLTDNWGYNDEHLSPGEGNTPVKEIITILKKNGYKGPLVVEPGADATTDLGDFHGVMKAWRMFGSNIYGAATPGRNPKWGDVQYGWMGKPNPPYFTQGSYVPGEDWTFWSGTPLE